MTRLKFNQYLHEIEEQNLKGHNEIFGVSKPYFGNISFERIHTNNNQVIYEGHYSHLARNQQR